MSTKPITYQAAQAKFWKAERTALLKAARKLSADFNAEEKRLCRIRDAAVTAVNNFRRRGGLKRDRMYAQIDRRVGILNGKLGL